MSGCQLRGYMTSQEAASEIGVSRSMVSRYIKHNRLPAIWAGGHWLIKRADVKRFRRRPPGNPNFLK